MLNLLGWGLAGIVLVNLVAGAALGAAFGWHRWLKPKLARRSARQRSFERLLAQSPIDNTSPMPEPNEALESHGVHHG